MRVEDFKKGDVVTCDDFMKTVNPLDAIVEGVINGWVHMRFLKYPTSKSTFDQYLVSSYNLRVIYRFDDELNELINGI